MDGGYAEVCYARASGPVRRDLGGAVAIIATAASGSSMSPLVKGLAPGGTLVIAGASPDRMQVHTSDRVFSGQARFRVVLDTPS